MADYTTADPIRENPSDQTPPSITIYENRDFQGDYWTVNSGMEYVGGDWNDRISSFRINSGSFEFYGGIRYGSEDWGPVRLGVGDYPWVADVGIRNDTISSWKAYYGAGTPVVVPPVVPPIIPPVEQPIDFVSYDSVSDPNDAGCREQGGRIYFNNRHPSKSILAHYHYFSSPNSPLVQVVPPNNVQTIAGCGLGNSLNIDSAEFVAG